MNFWSGIKVYHNIKKSAFIIMDNPFNTEAKPYTILKVYNYKKGFPQLIF